MQELPSSLRRVCVQLCRLLDECLERRLVYLVSFVEIDRTPGAAFETGVEELFRVLQASTFGECQLDRLLVCLSRADDSAMRPHGPTPLPFLDDRGVGLFD